MQFINIHDAKTNLSKYLEQLQYNQEMIIICKNGKPIAQLTTYIQPKKRILGAMKNKIVIADDFEELPEDFEGNFK